MQKDEWFLNFIKILIPAFIGVGFKIAIEMKKDKTKISIINVILSMVIGITGAWIMSGVIKELILPTYVPAVIALIAILSDKIGEFVIYKFNVDTFLTALINYSLDVLVNVFKSKK